MKKSRSQGWTIFIICFLFFFNCPFPLQAEGKASTQQHPAQKHTKKKKKASKKPKSKWSGNFSTGFQYNTNATSEPTKRPVPTNESGFKYPLSFGINYQVFDKDPWSLKASYNQSNSFYDEILADLTTTTYSPSFTLSHKTKWSDRPLEIQWKPGFSYTLVNEKYFNKSYQNTCTFIYSVSPKYRLTFSEKLSFEAVASKGAKKSVTSKQGRGSTTTIKNEFYMNKKKTKYMELSFAYDRDDTEGANFFKNEYDPTIAFNFPFYKDWKGHAGFKFKYADYSHTTATIGRIDRKYIPGTSLSIPIIDEWKLKVEYEYTNDDSNDPAFKHDNHAAGMSFSRNF